MAAVVWALNRFEGVKGRQQVRVGLAGSTVIDDSYNANPDSVRAAIDVLASASGRRILVLGDMGEVGDQGPEFHREAGAYARERGIDALHALGEATTHAVAAFGTGALHYADHASIADALHPQLDARTTVLVKGSRFMRMERVVAAIEEKDDVSSGGAPAATGGVATANGASHRPQGGQIVTDSQGGGHAA